MARSSARGSERTPLGVGQVAGVVVGDLPRRAGRRGLAQAEPLEEEAHVDHAPVEFLRPRLVRRAAQNQMILVHGRAAARRVGQDGVDVVGEGVEVAPREGLRRGEIAVVPGQPAAAALLRRDDDLHAVAREDLDRRRVDVRVEHPLGAAGQERDSRAALTPARESPAASAGRAGPFPGSARTSPAAPWAGAGGRAGRICRRKRRGGTEPGKGWSGRR